MKDEQESSAGRESAHWSEQDEEAAGYWQLKLLLVLFRILPVFILRLIMFPVGFFYFIFSKRGRKESRRFLQRAAPFIDDPKIAKKCRAPLAPLRHIVSFSLAITEKIQSWGNRFSFDNIQFQDDDMADLIGELEKGKGVLVVCSHLGNTELMRGLSYFDKTGVSHSVAVTAIMDMKTTSHFTRMLKELNPQSEMNIISSEEIGPQTVVFIEEKIAEGGLVAIAGDRTKAEGKNIMIPFLGEDAPFPAGIFYMSCMIEAPVYFAFGLRRRDLSLIPKYDIHVHRSTGFFGSTRKERFEKSTELARSFASLLENYCKKKPFQWYNFYDFWNKGV